MSWSTHTTIDLVSSYEINKSLLVKTLAVGRSDSHTQDMKIFENELLVI